MFELVPARLMAILALLLAAFAAGWYVNGSRLEAAQTRRLAIEGAKAIARERELQAAADKLKEAKDAEIRSINARLSAALVELRSRPPRPTGETASAPATAQGCTGAQLYREDGEFLAREAARADEIRAAYRQCAAQYDEVTGNGRR